MTQPSRIQRCSPAARNVELASQVDVEALAGVLGCDQKTARLDPARAGATSDGVRGRAAAVQDSRIWGCRRPNRASIVSRTMPTVIALSAALKVGQWWVPT